MGSCDGRSDGTLLGYKVSGFEGWLEGNADGRGDGSRDGNEMASTEGVKVGAVVTIGAVKTTPRRLGEKLGELTAGGSDVSGIAKSFGFADDSVKLASKS